MINQEEEPVIYNRKDDSLVNKLPKDLSLMPNNTDKISEDQKISSFKSNNSGLKLTNSIKKKNTNNSLSFRETFSFKNSKISKTNSKVKHKSILNSNNPSFAIHSQQIFDQTSLAGSETINNQNKTSYMENSYSDANEFIENSESSESDDNEKLKIKKKKKLYKKLEDILNKVKKKKRFDYNDIVDNINKGNYLDVKEKLTSPEFLKFYRNKDNLFKKDEFFDIIFKKLSFKLIIDITEGSNSAFEYNKDYIFSCILFLLHPNNRKNRLNRFEKISQKNNELFDNIKSQNTLSRYLGSPPEMFHEGDDNLVFDIIKGIVEYKLYDTQSSIKIKIIGWCLALLGSFDYRDDEECNPEHIPFIKFLGINGNFFQEEKNKFQLSQENIENLENIEINENIDNYVTDNNCYIETIKNCLECNYEELAIILGSFMKKNISLLTCCYEIAAKNDNITFLQFVWENTYKSINEKGYVSKKTTKFTTKGRRSIITNAMNKSTSMRNQEIKSIKTNNAENYMDIIIRELNNKENYNNKKNHKNKNENKKNDKIKQIFEWENISKESLLTNLFHNECFEHICCLLKDWPTELFVKKEFFRQSIAEKQKELILFYLTKIECREVLYEEEVQKIIVETYIPDGELFYYGAECLSYIYKNKWKENFTKELCRNITKTVKTKDILNCHSPILTCLLLLEFIKQIKFLSSSEINKCEKVFQLLIDFCQGIQESIHNENEIAYLMKQKDSKDRSVFQIISDNQLYQLLETPEIGLIIKKMWDGTLNSNGLKNSSSLSRFLFNVDDNLNPFDSFESLDPSKVYFFQLIVRLDSCSQRFSLMGLFSLFLVLTYSLYIYTLNDKDEVLNNFEEVSLTSKTYLVTYLILVHLLVINIIIEFIFMFLSNRRIKFEVWNVLDILLLIFAWLTLLDTKKFTGEYADDNIYESAKDLMWSIQIPVLNGLETEDSSFSTQVSFWIRIVILSINDIIVWSRITGTLLVYRQMGPVIRMVFAMGGLLIKYIFILVLFMVCCAGIFTCIFNRHSGQFVDFSTSVISLFGAFLNDFDCYDFDSNYKVIGSIILLVYVCIASVLFVNLLIAIISNGFVEINKVVESSHRAVLIQYCQKYHWSEYYGYSIILPPFFSIAVIPIFFINLILYPFIKKNNNGQKNFNKYATRVIYLIFIFPLIIAMFAIYTVILIPFVYIKGLMKMVKYLSTNKMQRTFKFFYFANWLFFGMFYLVYIFLRDIYLCFFHVFKETEQRGDEILRIKKNLSDNDVITFLKFIHSPQAKESSTDVHSMFMAYLNFEKTENEIKNGSKRSNTNSSLNDKDNSIKGHSKDINDIHNSNVANEEYRNDITTKIRKNLMVIETLENFVADDDNIATSYVNIEKMRKMLPLIFNVKEKHFGRLLYSNVSILGAMNRIKLNKVNFRQYLLTKQIIDYAKNIDRQIDFEISYTQRKLISDEKKIKLKEENTKYENTTNNKAIKDFKKFLKDVKQENDAILLKKKKMSVELKDVKDINKTASLNDQESSSIDEERENNEDPDNTNENADEHDY